MVLHGRLCGRVGRRQAILPNDGQVRLPPRLLSETKANRIERPATGSGDKPGPVVVLWFAAARVTLPAFRPLSQTVHWLTANGHAEGLQRCSGALSSFVLSELSAVRAGALQLERASRRRSLASGGVRDGAVRCPGRGRRQGAKKWIEGLQRTDWGPFVVCGLEDSRPSAGVRAPKGCCGQRARGRAGPWMARLPLIPFRWSKLSRCAASADGTGGRRCGLAGAGGRAGSRRWRAG